MKKLKLSRMIAGDKYKADRGFDKQSEADSYAISLQKKGHITRVIHTRGQWVPFFRIEKDAGMLSRFHVVRKQG